MLQLIEEDLIFRLKNTEDTLVERKTCGDSKDWLKTVVAFANSAPIVAPAVLFIGVKDDGTPEDRSPDWDSLQKTLGQKLSAAYPTIPYVTKILSHVGKPFLAVIVEGSAQRPHFAGPSYVREGSSSKVASKEQFEQLVAERNAKTYEILKWKGKLVTVDSMNPSSAVFSMGLVGSTAGMKVFDCNLFFVTLEGNNFSRSVPLSRVDLAFDDKEKRLKLEVRPV